MNRDTRPAGEFAVSARLKGWHRVWEHRTSDPDRLQQCTSLSVEPAHDADDDGIDGVVARLPVSQLPELDARETGYERLNLPADDFDLPEDVVTDTVCVYRSMPKNRYLADPAHPILQSYIDCVMAGYKSRFGITGMHAMLSTTRGWEHGILNDRSKPHYPRWVPIDPELKQQIDALVESRSKR